MAYYQQLDSVSQHTLYLAIEGKVREEANCMYNEALRKAKTAKQKKACAGQYIGRWYPLLNAWMQGEVSNLAVRDALRVGFVGEELYVQLV